MFHVRRSEKDFKYFSHSLLEVNQGFEEIAFVGGDRDQAQKGFLRPLKRSIFLPCKKHVEDNISRKLSNLGNSAMKNEVLRDIFGDERNKEKGIVDSTSRDEFLAKVIAVTEKWDFPEKCNYPDKEPAFSDYFRRNIEEDVKNGMILSVRRSVGLEDEFFYNNAQECANFKYKSKIKESKMQTATGYRPNTTCTWVEAISIYKNLLEETSRYKQLAVLQKGPLQLSSRYDHLYVLSLQWSKMITAQKQKHLAKLHVSQKNDEASVIDPDCPGEGSAKGTNAADDCDVIGDFDEFNLPEFLKGTWKNESRIVVLEGVGPFPNDAGKRTVISLSSPTAHTVEIKTKGKEFV